MISFCTIALRANCANPFSKFGFNLGYVLYNGIRHFSCLRSPSYFQLQSRNSKSLQKYEIIRNHNISSLPSWITRVVNMLRTPASRYKKAGVDCFSCVDDINYVEFFTLLNMPDTFYSWFKVTELHIWMLLFKLCQHDSFVRPFRSGLIKGMWIDVEKRAKAVDSLNKNYKKNVKELDNRFRTSLFVYDLGFLSDDKILTSALWFQFFEKDCKDPRDLEALVSFIRYQVDYLNNVTFEQLESGEKVKMWTPFTPHFKLVKEAM